MNINSQWIQARPGAIPPKYWNPGRRPFIVPAGGAFMVAGAALILFLFNPARFDFYPVCQFYRMTGLLCPGCGSLRAMHCLLHGELAAAAHFNVLLIGSLPLLAWFILRWFIRRSRNEPIGLPVRSRWGWFGLIVLVLFGILRNLPFASAAWLAP